jgi:hypothetical protein
MLMPIQAHGRRRMPTSISNTNRLGQERWRCESRRRDDPGADAATLTSASSIVATNVHTRSAGAAGSDRYPVQNAADPGHREHTHAASSLDRRLTGPRTERDSRSRSSARSAADSEAKMARSRRIPGNRPDSFANPPVISCRGRRDSFKQVRTNQEDCVFRWTRRRPAR